MIDLQKKGLPNSIQSLDGEPILLNTDFRLWIRFYEEFERFNNHVIDEIDCSYLFVNEPPIIDKHILKRAKTILI